MLREVSGGHGAVQSKGGRRGDRATQELGSAGFGVTARAWLEPEWRGSREGKCDLPQVFRGPLAPRGAQPGSGRKLFQEPRWLTTGGPWGWGKDDIPRAFWQVDPADSHTPGPHYSPQAQTAGFMGLLSPGNPRPAHPRGPRGLWLLCGLRPLVAWRERGSVPWVTCFCSCPSVFLFLRPGHS